MPLLPLFDQPTLAQDAAAISVHTGEEEPAIGPSDRIVARFQVKRRHPIFRAKVFEIDPHWFYSAHGHLCQRCRRQGAAKPFDQHITRAISCWADLRPSIDLHTLNRDALTGRHFGQRRNHLARRDPIIHPHRHGVFTFILAHPLARQTPAHADIPEVVDDGAVQMNAPAHKLGIRI